MSDRPDITTAKQTDAVLAFNGVSKRFGGFTAVGDLSFAIPAGSIYGFLGPNGAGKTTSLRMALDIICPTQGEISILGASHALAVRNRIGYLPEEKGLYKKMKAWAVIQYFAMLKGMAKAEAKQRALALLSQYGLEEFANHKVESLSKGMGQKVQVLAAVAHDPELVILDEPFSGLDPVNQSVLEDLIHDLAARGKTVIFSTHVMQHAERLCDHLLLIAHGHKIFDGSVAAAKASLPRRVLIESPSDTQPLAQLPDVLGVEPLPVSAAACPQWQITISEQADPQQLLGVCFQHNVQLQKFEFTEPTLHDVFVALVGRHDLELAGTATAAEVTAP